MTFSCPSGHVCIRESIEDQPDVIFSEIAPYKDGIKQDWQIGLGAVADGADLLRFCIEQRYSPAGGDVQAVAPHRSRRIPARPVAVGGLRFPSSDCRASTTMRCYCPAPRWRSTTNGQPQFKSQEKFFKTASAHWNSHRPDIPAEYRSDLADAAVKFSRVLYQIGDLEGARKGFRFSNTARIADLPKPTAQVSHCCPAPRSILRGGGRLPLSKCPTNCHLIFLCPGHYGANKTTYKKGLKVHLLLLAFSDVERPKGVLAGLRLPVGREDARDADDQNRVKSDRKMVSPIGCRRCSSFGRPARWDCGTRGRRGRWRARQAGRFCCMEFCNCRTRRNSGSGVATPGWRPPAPNHGRRRARDGGSLSRCTS